MGMGVGDRESGVVDGGGVGRWSGGLAPEGLLRGGAGDVGCVVRVVAGGGVRDVG
ncbi:hypothetical protein Aglo03_60850 [Actinokineospora globicatena]|uniref:Uncharacterized protein n=1 Tax=Actinokineospora globicatena TaxID=103729 RepID=A0A9W6VCS4_9PSEU|nr:hypothetical protein Aglo03_60850 [Actinokineospora globicatena]